jgi:hypothetical protein
MNNPHITIPAPGPGEDTTFTLEVWEQHDMPPILHLAEGWTEIEAQAFTDNPDLEEIHIPASVVNILEDAFAGAINLRQVDFAEGSRLDFIGEGAFHGAIALERINIPPRVTRIGHGAFNNTTALEQVTFEEGSQLEMIGFQAFSDARALQRIRIPAGVRNIDNFAFFNASSLVEVTFEEGSQLEFIGDGAFDGATALQRFQIPANVADIGQGAFRNMTSLQTIHIPRLVQTLMNLTFNNATSLREVTFEEGSMLQTIAGGVFAGATALQTIQIPAGVISIGRIAFRGATALQTIQIPAGVTEIGEAAFSNTTNLREIIFEQGSQITRIDHNAFGESGLTLVAIGETALNRLNTDANSRNRLEIASRRQPIRFLPEVHFGNNNNFYGNYPVKIVSRTQQINTLAMIASKPVYKKRGPFGRFQQTFLGKPKKLIRGAIAQDLVRKVGSLMTDIEPKSGNTLSPTQFAAATAEANPEKIAAANARVAAIEAAEGGARKSRRRKRGIRRKSRKSSSARRRTQNRKSKLRRTMKRK